MAGMPLIPVSKTDMNSKVSFISGSSGTERMATEGPPIIMTLPPHLQEGIPDGYELVPVDRITDEYEIVPWKQVKTLLNITIGQINPAAHGGM